MNCLRIIFLLFLLVSCERTKQTQSIRFFDLKAFFTGEICRLATQKIKVNKTVSRNGISESKKNIFPNWETELSLFLESDINKPAWTDSYLVSNNNYSTSYIASDSKLRTRKIVIKKNNEGKIVELSVVNRTTNFLYSSSEALLYIPDSLYQITKKQDVILLGKNSYKIFGIF